MILELVADCPDCLEEAQTWRPKSYAAHFSDSAFAARDFVIAAYNQAPAVFRDPFEQTVAAMNALVEQGVKELVARSERAGRNMGLPRGKTRWGAHSTA